VVCATGKSPSFLKRNHPLARTMNVRREQRSSMQGVKIQPSQRPYSRHWVVQSATVRPNIVLQRRSGPSKATILEASSEWSFMPLNLLLSGVDQAGSFSCYTSNSHQAMNDVAIIYTWRILLPLMSTQMNISGIHLAYKFLLDSGGPLQMASPMQSRASLYQHPLENNI